MAMVTQNHSSDLEKAVTIMRNDMGSYSSIRDYLDINFAWRHSFLLGLASIFDFPGSLSPRYRPIEDSAASDASAIAGDWRAVGDDFRRIMVAASNLDINKQTTD